MWVVICQVWHQWSQVGGLKVCDVYERFEVRGEGVMCEV